MHDVAWTRRSAFIVDLPDRPGELARFSARLRAADVALVALWVRRPGDGADGPPTELVCVPEAMDQFREFCRSAELDPREEPVLHLEDRDAVGALVRTLEQIAEASINLRDVHAVVVDGRFGCFVSASPEDWMKLDELIAGVAV